MCRNKSTGNRPINFPGFKIHSICKNCFFRNFTGLQGWNSFSHKSALKRVHIPFFYFFSQEKTFARNNLRRREDEEWWWNMKVALVWKDDKIRTFINRPIYKCINSRIFIAQIFLENVKRGEVFRWRAQERTAWCVLLVVEIGGKLQAMSLP